MFIIDTSFDGLISSICERRFKVLGAMREDGQGLQHLLAGQLDVCNPFVNIPLPKVCLDLF